MNLTDGAAEYDRGGSRQIGRASTGPNTRWGFPRRGWGRRSSPTTAIWRVRIEQASAQIGTDRDAIVACVWRPLDVCFKPVAGRRIRPCIANEVEGVAQETAAHAATVSHFQHSVMVIHESSEVAGMSAEVAALVK